MTVTIAGEGLGIDEIAAVSRGEGVRLTDDPAVLERMRRARDVVRRALESGQQIYGVTTLFGGMADQYVGPAMLADVQRLALWQHKSTTGPRLPAGDVRAAMLLRANSLMKGASGVRLEVVERFATFLNAGATPHVYQHGSIGASGDLIPLSYIAGAIVGLDPAFLVDLDGETLDAHAALRRLELTPLTLEPKEGLALSNGTGASTGVAANVIARALDAVSLALGAHALYAQALVSTDQSFAPFIHAMKPHPGQIWTATRMAALLSGSRVIRSEAAGKRGHGKGKLIQDRYSLRCLPQFLGPIVDGLATASRQIVTEANCANDNPLIDVDSSEILHTGNFLGQYTGVSMDSLRYLLALMTKHLDAQVALLMTPEFSYGLSASLVGNEGTEANVGLKSLQIAGNAMMPLVSFYGQAVVDRFPTHAEQFNQNINSQAMNAANLARTQMDLLEHYLAAAILIGVQAVELRAKRAAGSYDARCVLSEATVPLYLSARRAAGGEPAADRPLFWNDFDGFIQPKVEGILHSISTRGAVLNAMAPVRASLLRFSA